MKLFLIGLGLVMGIAPAVSPGAPPPAPTLESKEEPTWHGKTLQQWLRVLDSPGRQKRLDAVKAIGKPQPGANDQQQRVAMLALLEAWRSGDRQIEFAAQTSMGRLAATLAPAVKELLPRLTP